MKIRVKELLQWRLNQAEAEAPPAPSGARLLELARPWWETWPERFQSLVNRLSKIQIAYGHAMADRRRSRNGYPVPALLVRAGQELETSARVLYLNVRGGQMRLRFQVDALPEECREALDTTFVCIRSEGPVLVAPAVWSVGNEYRIEVSLPEELGRSWEQLKVTDRMPFRLIFHGEAGGG